MLDRIYKTAKAVSEKTGATITFQLDMGELNSISMQIYPAGWFDACDRAANGTASPEDLTLSRSSKHYNFPPSSEGQAEAMEILEGMLCPWACPWS